MRSVHNYFCNAQFQKRIDFGWELSYDGKRKENSFLPIYIIQWDCYIWDNKYFLHSTISYFHAGDCEEVGVEITCMQFDPSLRRLITGARNGSVKVWNFNNGACLWDLETELDREITSLCCPRDRILVTGWNRQVFLITIIVLKYYN